MRALLLLLSSTLIWAADVTGSWSGPLEATRNGETRTSTALLVLKQDGSKITGTIGPNEGSRTEISKGSIVGSDVTLEAVVAERDLRVTLNLKLEGDKLVGDLKVASPDGQQMTGKMNLDRAK
jgi:hypothetical protein